MRHWIGLLSRNKRGSRPERLNEISEGHGRIFQNRTSTTIVDLSGRIMAWKGARGFICFPLYSCATPMSEYYILVLDIPGLSIPKSSRTIARNCSSHISYGTICWLKIIIFSISYPKSRKPSFPSQSQKSFLFTFNLVIPVDDQLFILLFVLVQCLRRLGGRLGVILRSLPQCSTEVIVLLIKSSTFVRWLPRS